MAISYGAKQLTTGSATEIVAEQTPSPSSRRSICIRNLGPNRIYVGDSSVTTATGFPIDPNGTLVLDKVPASGLYGITEVTSQSTPLDTRYFAEVGV